MSTPVKDRHILLVGNAPYVNRGNEAIVRGTVRILRRAFGEQTRFDVASYGPRQSVIEQGRAETDAAIAHAPLFCDRYSIPWALDQCNRRLGWRTAGKHWMIRGAVRRAAFALEIGGDNYSLDYGRPLQFIELDQYLLRERLPLFLWGASVGPFTRDPEFARVMHAHLERVSGIFARETVTLDYLRSHIPNARAWLVADPAFALEPEEPPAELVAGVDLAAGPVGLNLAPSMAKYITGGDRAEWERRCVESVVQTMRQVSENILLVPHVFHAAADNNDETLLAAVAERVRAETGRELPVASRKLTAAQIKWVVAHCSLFAGARMHSTIAALSSGVPTLNLAYSIKARGVSRDVFDHEEFCVGASEMLPATIAARLSAMYARRAELCNHLAARIPVIRQRAFAAGDLLRQALEGAGAAPAS